MQNWIELYANEVSKMLKGDYGPCPCCGKTMTRDDIANQIDAETAERAELCIECWKTTKEPYATI